MRSALFSSVRERIISRMLRNTVRIEEHMLCTAKTNTLCTEASACIFSILWRIGVGTDLQLSVLHLPMSIIRSEVSGDRKLPLSLTVAVIDLAGGTIQRNIISLVEVYVRHSSKVLCLLHGSQYRRSLIHSRFPYHVQQLLHGDVIPPRTVRIPSDACIPSISSGEVSKRTRTTLSPLLMCLFLLLLL